MLNDDEKCLELVVVAAEMGDFVVVVAVHYHCLCQKTWMKIDAGKWPRLVNMIVDVAPCHSCWTVGVLAAAVLDVFGHPKEENAAP
jgi:hypothetical protein